MARQEFTTYYFKLPTIQTIQTTPHHHHYYNNTTTPHHYTLYVDIGRSNFQSNKDMQIKCKSPSSDKKQIMVTLWKEEEKKRQRERMKVRLFKVSCHKMSNGSL